MVKVCNTVGGGARAAGAAHTEQGAGACAVGGVTRGRHL